MIDGPRSNVDLPVPAISVPTATRSTSDISVDHVASEANPRELMVGQRIDHFELIRELGVGSSSEVWLALDTRLGRGVAIKFSTRLIDPDSHQKSRFCREAQLASGLNHPHIVRVYDAVLTRRSAYIVIEYCPGPTLFQWLSERGQTPSVELALRWMLQLSDAVAAAHSRGLIHRDIKPSNIIVTDLEAETPRLRLTDFGMARLVEEPTQTRDGSLIGTVPYMSPEQARGEIGQHGPRSDVYALGVLMYEMLTGVSPFRATTEVESLRRVLEWEPLPLGRLRSEVPADLAAVCMKCIEKRPQDRYGDARHLHDDLVRVREHRPTLARPIGPLGTAVRFARRHQAATAFMVMAVLAVLVWVVELVAYAESQRLHALESREHSAQLQAALTQTQAANRRWQEATYASDLVLAYSMLERGQYGGARRLLDRHDPAQSSNASDEFPDMPVEVSEDCRGPGWFFLDTELKSRYQVWGSHAGVAEAIAVAPEHNRVATVGSDGRLLQFDASTGQLIRQWEGFVDRDAALAFLPNGDLAVAGPTWITGHRNLVTLNPESGKAKQILNWHPTTIECIRASRDGQTIASGCRYEGIQVWSEERQRCVMIPNRLRSRSFALDPHGQWLATGEKHAHELRVHDTRDGSIRQQFPLSRVALVANAANRHPWVAHSLDAVGGVGIVDVQTGRQGQWIEAESPARAIQFSPSDRSLVVADQNQGLNWYVGQWAEASDELVSDGTETRDPLSDWRRTHWMAGRDGSFTDVAFLSETTLLTTSRGGVIEWFCPTGSSHDRQALPEHVSHVVARDVDHVVMSIGQRLFQDGAVWWEGPGEIVALAQRNENEWVVADRQNKLHWIRRESRESAGNVDSQSVGLPMPESDDRRYDQVAVSKDGRFVVASGSSRFLVVFDTQRSRAEPWLVRPLEKTTVAVRFDPQGRWLATVQENSVALVNLQTGDVTDHRTDFDRATCLTFLPSDPNDPEAVELMVGCREGTLLRWNLKSGEKTQLSTEVLRSDQDRACPVAIELLDDDCMFVLRRDAEIQFWDLRRWSFAGGMKMAPLENATDSACELICISPSNLEWITRRTDGKRSELLHWKRPSESPRGH